MARRDPISRRGNASTLQGRELEYALDAGNLQNLTADLISYTPSLVGEAVSSDNLQGAIDELDEAISSIGTSFNQTIEDEGTPVTQRSNVNFTGAGVTVTDAGGKTVVTIPGGGVGGVDTANSPNANEFARFTDADTIEGRTVSETKADLSLDNVTNTSDANKPVSTAQQAALDLKANIASPTLTGTPAAPTAAPGTNTTQISTTAFVQAAIAALINSAPGALDTLDELAAAFGDDPNFAATMTTALAGKQPIDADLTSIAALTTTAFGRGLLELVNAAELRDAASLGTMATQDDSAVAITGGSAVFNDDSLAVKSNGDPAFKMSIMNVETLTADRRLRFILNNAQRTLTLTGDASIRETNTGDNATNTQYSGLAASKQDTLVSGTNIKTINGSTLLGSGDLVVTGSSAYPPGLIFGLTMSNAADTANDITVAAGKARDEADTADMVLAAPITKRLDAAWAVGTNQGGLNTGAEANSTWYEVILIKRTDTGVVDVMFSTTANRATLPASYDKYRRIGWIRNDGAGSILQFSQSGDYITLVTPQNDVSATVTGTTATNRTLTVPPNCLARFRGSCLGNVSINAANAVVFSETTEADTAPTTTNGYNSIGSGDFAIQGAGHFELRVNASSQIRDRGITATGTMAYDISTFGWIDDRCQLSN